MCCAVHLAAVATADADCVCSNENAAQYKVTNQGMDTEEMEVFKTRLQKWCKMNDVEGVSADEAAINEVGLDLETKHFFDVYGLVVSERRIVDNVDGFNIFVNISMQLLIVLAQLILVILPPIILIIACFGQQQIHKDTVAMFPVLDFNSIQALGGENVAFKSLEMYSLTTMNMRPSSTSA